MKGLLILSLYAREQVTLSSLKVGRGSDLFEAMFGGIDSLPQETQPRPTTTQFHAHTHYTNYIMELVTADFSHESQLKPVIFFLVTTNAKW